MTASTKTVRTLSGKVVSNKMEKTISVRIERVIQHPMYGKFVRKSVTILAHDENNESREGDTVIVSACRPLSKNKVWKLDRILN
jgi:small subunit ribosomal protein S17